MRLMPLLLLVAALPAMAAEPKPEIDRPAATAQAIGAAHSLRTIPEACARLEGLFTGDVADPYQFAVVRSSPNCQPRARFVDAAKTKPSRDSGWILNDLISVPNAACPSQQAVVHVWRKSGQGGTPELDAQGKVRVYLDGSKPAGDKPSTASMFSAVMKLEGEPCGG